VKKLILIFTFLLLAADLAADQQIPKSAGLINDRAGVLKAGDVRRLETKAGAYRDRTGNELAVLIVQTLDDRSLEDYAHDVFKAWGIGSSDKDNGVLFLVAIQERKARIEVGYGLEAQLTDIECGRLVSKRSPMADSFREGDYAGGVNAVLDGIVQAIGGEYNPPPPKESSKDNGVTPLVMLIFFVVWAAIFILRSRGGGGWTSGGSLGGRGSSSRGGFTFGGGSGFSGGSSFGGGSSGGGGASGGW